MKINRNSIKNYLKLDIDIYDEQIDMSIDILLNQICSYCNNDFIKKNYSNFYVYKNGLLEFSNDTITSATDLSIFEQEDYIRVYGTLYNDGLYRVEYKDNNNTLIVNGDFKTETVSGYIALVDFPNEFLAFIAKSIKNNVIENQTIKKEKINDAEIEYFEDNFQEFYAFEKCLLNNYRKVYKDRFFNN